MDKSPHARCVDETLTTYIELPGELKKPLCEWGETLGLFAKSLYEEGEPLRAWVETP